MGDTDDGDESVHRRLSPRTGKRVEAGAQQAIGLLERLHPDGNAECIVQPFLRQAEADGKPTYREL